MNSLLLSNAGGTWLTVAYIIVGALIVIASIAAFIARLVVVGKYSKYNNVQASFGHTGFSAARNLLDANGMQDVQVKPLGFFRAMFYGNHYSARTKTIYLRKRLINSTSITSVGLATQKVGHAIQHKENNPTFKFRSLISPFIIFAPALFLPLIIIGFVLDIVYSLGGYCALAAVLIGVFLYLLAFLFTLLTIPVESRANKLALELMERTGFLNEDERFAIKEVFSAYIVAYIMEFLVSLLQLIKTVLQILISAKK